MLNATLPADGEAPLPRVRRPDLAATDPITSAILAHPAHLNP
ncbi:hypothetical protein V6U90_29230 [Micromonospora sp. CPCC 206060]